MNEVSAAAPRVWPRVRWTRAAQVAPFLEDPAVLEAVGAMPPATAFSVLRESDPAGAANFIAHCLPRIDAVRWLVGCMALAPSDPPPKRAVAAKAVRRWIANPSDDARRLAHEAGETAGWDTVEGLACLAVFLSGGSMAPAAQEHPVNPQPGNFGKVVGGAVLVAGLAAGGAAFAERMDTMLAHAEAIAAGDAA